MWYTSGVKGKLTKTGKSRRAMAHWLIVNLHKNVNVCERVRYTWSFALQGDFHGSSNATTREHVD